MYCEPLAVRLTFCVLEYVPAPGDAMGTLITTPVGPVCAPVLTVPLVSPANTRGRKRNSEQKKKKVFMGEEIKKKSVEGRRILRPSILYL